MASAPSSTEPSGLGAWERREPGPTSVLTMGSLLLLSGLGSRGVGSAAPRSSANSGRHRRNARTAWVRPALQSPPRAPQIPRAPVDALIRHLRASGTALNHVGRAPCRRRVCLYV